MKTTPRPQFIIQSATLSAVLVTLKLPMKSPILSCAVVLTLALGPLSFAHADSATWSTNPISSDWNTAANWMPATVPDGPADIATFSTSSRSTAIIFNVQIEVASVVFDPGDTSYTIIVGGHKNFGELTIGDAGIVNNSGKLQKFVGRGNAGEIVFTGNANAGSRTRFIMHGGRSLDAGGGLTSFNDQSSADHAAFIIDGAEGNNAFNGEVEFSITPPRGVQPF
jgi:hypothetical protein